MIWRCGAYSMAVGAVNCQSSLVPVHKRLFCQVVSVAGRLRGKILERRMVDAEGANREGKVAGSRGHWGSRAARAGEPRCGRSGTSGRLEARDESEVVGDHR
jgi:hypothetical protein